MKNISVLYLRGNNLEYIDDAVEEWNHLRTLDISQNELRSLPEGIYKCRELVSINLSNSKFLTGFSESIGNLTQLKTLNLTLCTQLESLPPSIGRLKPLEVLSLYKCQNLLMLPE